MPVFPSHEQGPDKCLQSLTQPSTTATLWPNVPGRVAGPWQRRRSRVRQDRHAPTGTTFDHWNIETVVRICVRYGVEDFTSC
ncbi:hypothetical protein NSND_62783 [Nitrospira sp. ND1]|nr:hypothetical protein NSND_62783 [Nitrospira sp. ND1]